MRRVLGPLSRPTAHRQIDEAPDGHTWEICEPTRNGEQNRRFHAMVGDIARSGLEWAGKRRSAAQWKALMVSGHAVATKEGADMVPGLEGEFLNLRESTALMSVKRAASLITYVQAWGDLQGVVWSEPKENENAMQNRRLGGYSRNA